MAPRDVTPPDRTARSRRTRQAFAHLRRHDDRVRGRDDSPTAQDDDQRALLLREIVTLNLGVAEAIAQRYRGRGVPEDDLCQVAYEGLVKAVGRFDPSVSDDLLTYAVPVIRGEVQRYFRDSGWMIRPPRRVQELRFKLQSLHEDLAHELGRTPTDAEVVDRLECTPQDLREASAANGCFLPTSLDRPVGPSGDSVSLADLLPDSEAGTAAAEARVLLHPLLRGLPARDRLVIKLRFFDDLTQEDIGRRLGVTQMQISRILSRILDTLRRRLEDSESDAA